MALFWARLWGKGPFTKEVPLVLSLVFFISSTRIPDPKPSQWTCSGLFPGLVSGSLSLQSSLDAAKCGWSKIRSSRDWAAHKTSLYYTWPVSLRASVPQTNNNKQLASWYCNLLDKKENFEWFKQRADVVQGGLFFFRFYVRLGYFTVILWKKKGYHYSQYLQSGT